MADPRDDMNDHCYKIVRDGCMWLRYSVRGEWVNSIAGYPLYALVEIPDKKEDET